MCQTCHLGHAKVVRSADGHFITVASSTLQVAVCSSHAQRTVVVANVTTGVAARLSTSNSLLVESVADVASEAVEVRRRVGHHVVGTDGVCVARIGETTNGRPTAVAHVLADTGSAEQVILQTSTESGGCFTTQANFTEVAGQTHGGFALEIKARTIASVAEDFAFQPEASLQTATQVFSTAQAQTAGSVTACTNTVLCILAISVVHVRHASVNDTEQSHGRLSHCGAGSGQHCQGNQRFFHYELLQGLEGRRFYGRET
ncbi:hypothetical protein SDC9_116834 [bioreactor metagenome]|uniref:Uncharacterized protein n=1 Tax=bioreactor metagenome TaxID=1076179 RepID=A0A645BWI5_9ZZZZ